MNKASLMVDIEGPSLSSDDIELIKSPYVGGLILFDRNFIDKDQLIFLLVFDYLTVADKY